MAKVEVPAVGGEINAPIDRVRAAIDQFFATSIPGASAVRWDAAGSAGIVEWESPIPNIGPATWRIQITLTPTPYTVQRRLRKFPASRVRFAGSVDCADTIRVFGVVPVQNAFQKSLAAMLNDVQRLSERRQRGIRYLG